MFYVSIKIIMICLILLAFLAASSEVTGYHNGTQRSCAGQGGEHCIFPMDYYGTIYYACIKEEGDWIDPWCATAVDADGGYTGDWAECNSECPVCKTTNSKICVIKLAICLTFDFRSCL